jgi:recombination protein RecA
MALKEALTRLDKLFGKGVVLRLGDHKPVSVESISTGIMGLDNAIGIGGLPKGRVVEIIGAESGGKTTLTLSVIAECQKAGGIAAFIDAEHSFDPVWAKKLGVDVDNLLVSQPDYGEQALEIAESLIRSGDIGIVVVDSVAALTPKSEIEGEFGDSQMGLQARMMSQAMRKLTSATHKSNAILVMINQIREKIGVFYGSNETTPGGRALRFYSSVRLDVRRASTLKDGEEPRGIRVKVKVIKNKCSAPFKTAEFDLIFGRGIDKEGDLVDLCTENGVISKSGAWFVTEGGRKFQGRDAVVQAFRDDSDYAGGFKTKLLEKLCSKG